MNAFKAEPPALKHEMRAALDRVLESGSYVLGDEVKAFERKWAAACDTTHAVGVANGLDAIEIILRALNIGPGDEVITTSMTAFATVLAIYRAGAIPVVADIDPATGLMSLASAQRCLSATTKAIVLVHLYGQLRDLPAWQRFCKRHGVMLVEDCAQAHGAQLDGVAAGSFGVAAAHSFYPTKNLGALGDGGAITTNDAVLASQAAQLRNYGQSERYVHPVLGLNSRLDEMQAALLSVRLRWLDSHTARRRAIAMSYLDGIRNPHCELLSRPVAPAAHVHHLFVLKCARRQELVDHLDGMQVQSLMHYPIPVHLQAPCRDARRDPQGLGASELYARQCLSIPCHPQLTDAEITRVTQAVNAFN